MSDTTSNDAVATLQRLSHLSLQGDELFTEQGQQIGYGGYGEVILAALRKPNETEALVAVKCVWAVGTSGDRQRFAMRFARELQVWGSVRHLNVLPLIGFYLSDNYAIAKLVSPYMSKGNVTQHISRTKPGLDKRVHFVLDLAAGVDFLHNHHPPICHGDLKPANVLVTDNEDAVLCDFGLASFADAAGTPSGLTTSRSVKGSTRYMSPELLLRNEGKHSLSSDIWGWGCTAFEILTDNIPYSVAKAEAQIILALDRGEKPGALAAINLRTYGPSTRNQIHSRTLDSLRFLIDQCWSFEPGKRPGMHAMVKTLPLNPTSQGTQGEAGIIGIVDIGLDVHQNLPESLKNDAYIKVVLNGRTRGSIRVTNPLNQLVRNSVYTHINVPVSSPREERIFARLDINVQDLMNDHSGLSVNRIVQDQTGMIRVMIQLKSPPLAFGGRNSLARNPLTFGGRNPPAIDEGDRTLEGTTVTSQGSTIPSPDMFSTAQAWSHRPSSQGWAGPSTALSIPSEGGTYYTARSHFSSYQMSIPGGYQWDPDSFN